MIPLPSASVRAPVAASAAAWNGSQITGIDRAALEGRAGIGRRQEHRLDLGIFDASLFQRFH
jgi:hypothetical protein